MVKVITYGTYDMLHYGHIRLLERAKALGDFLVVGVTSDDFDRTRGKINVQQSLEERIEAVRKTGLADLIIIEEYEGQKIEDIKKYNIDIFTVGSDWVGTFDYLNEYCKVVYLDRTKGVSSTEIRNEQINIRLGLVGNSGYLERVYNESKYVNMLRVVGIYSDKGTRLKKIRSNLEVVSDDYDDFLNQVDAVYVRSHPQRHYEQIRKALIKGKHVICESPMVLTFNEHKELENIAIDNNCILMETLRTDCAVAYHRMLLLAKAGKIGVIKNIEATCTSLNIIENADENTQKWGSMEAWGPTAMLPVFQLLGTDYIKKIIVSKYENDELSNDIFTKINFIYESGIGSITIGTGVKSEGNLIISGTKGYIYIPSPWWKTDYFEIRYENANDNKRYFYQLDGDGIRYELVYFVKSIQKMDRSFGIDKSITEEFARVMEDFGIKNNTIIIK